MSKKKRILLVTQYFFPENFKSNDIAFDLAAKGYEVSVLCGIPNYPEGKYYHGYSLFKRRIEKLNGVRIFRVFQTPRGKGNNIKLSLNYLTFAFFGSIWAIFLAIFFRYRCVIIHQTSPITQGLPAIIIKKLQKIPLYLWVLDIWPDAMKSGGGVTNKSVLSIIDRIVKLMYNESSKILISSRGFSDLIKSKGKYSDKIIYFPNWSEDILEMDDSYSIPTLPSGFKILMAGNLGTAQNIPRLMEVILELKDLQQIKWLFLGDGSMKGWMEEFVRKNKLEDIVYTFGRFPFEAMPAFFLNVDALVLSLKGEYPHLKSVVPARLQSYMSSGRPIIALADHGVKEIIREAACGFTVSPDNPEKLAEIIRDQIFKNKERFRELGLNGREYFKLNFTRDKCINDLCKLIESID